MAVYEADYVTVPVEGDGAEYLPEQIPAIVAELEAEMHRASEALEFERAAQLRDRILGMKDLEAGRPAQHHRRAGAARERGHVGGLRERSGGATAAAEAG